MNTELQDDIPLPPRFPGLIVEKILPRALRDEYMEGLNDDTPREVRIKLREMMLARPGIERMRMAADMFDSARSLVLASLPAGLGDTEIKRRLCQRLYRDEVDVEAVVRGLQQSRP